MNYLLKEDFVEGRTSIKNNFLKQYSTYSAMVTYVIYNPCNDTGTFFSSFCVIK